MHLECFTKLTTAILNNQYWLPKHEESRRFKYAKTGCHDCKSEKSVFYIRTVSSDDQIVINPSVCLRTGSPDGYQK